MMNSRVKLAILATIILISVTIYVSSIRKPDQINLILKIADKNIKISDIINPSANRIGMQLKAEDFKFGGDSSTLKTYLMYDSETSIMIQSISEEECQSREGRRDPVFSNTIYTVSIYRTSTFGSKRSLRDVATILGEEARRRGGTLVTEDQKCGG